MLLLTLKKLAWTHIPFRNMLYCLCKLYIAILCGHMASSDPCCSCIQTYMEPYPLDTQAILSIVHKNAGYLLVDFHSSCGDTPLFSLNWATCRSDPSLIHISIQVNVNRVSSTTLTHVVKLVSIYQAPSLCHLTRYIICIVA